MSWLSGDNPSGTFVSSGKVTRPPNTSTGTEMKLSTDTAQLAAARTEPEAGREIARASGQGCWISASTKLGCIRRENLEFAGRKRAWICWTGNRVNPLGKKTARQT